MTLLPLVILTHAEAVAPVVRAEIIITVLAKVRAIAGEVVLDAVAVFTRLITTEIVDALGHHAWPLGSTNKDFVIAASATAVDGRAGETPSHRVDAALAGFQTTRHDALRVPFWVLDVADVTGHANGAPIVAGIRERSLGIIGLRANREGEGTDAVRAIHPTTSEGIRLADKDVALTLTRRVTVGPIALRIILRRNGTVASVGAIRKTAGRSDDGRVTVTGEPVIVGSAERNVAIRTNRNAIDDGTRARVVVNVDGATSAHAVRAEGLPALRSAGRRARRHVVRGAGTTGVKDPSAVAVGTDPLVALAIVDGRGRVRGAIEATWIVR